MLDSHATALDVTIAGKDFTILQSPGILNSSRAGGTTGAALWKVTPLLAEWLSTPKNALFELGVLGPDSSILELGAGTAGVLYVLLKPRIARYIASDQQYALKLLGENIRNNTLVQRHGAIKRSRKSTDRSVTSAMPDLLALDWETDDVSSLLKDHSITAGVDLVIACDCIYNYVLIKPFVQTCIDVCRTRPSDQRPTVCLIAQQLRLPDVFEEFLSLFMQHFHVWRLSETTLGPRFNDTSGFVVHVGVLHGAML